MSKRDWLRDLLAAEEGTLPDDAPPIDAVVRLLLDGAQTFSERNKLYGNNFRRFGPIMTALFPKALSVRNASDWNRLGLLVMCVSKLSRYAEQFEHGGHTDSAHDLCVYAAMLESVTMERAR